MALPGLVKYNTLKPFGNNGNKYFMRLKLKRSASTDNFGMPGPNSYSTITTIKPDGIFSVSKYEKCSSSWIFIKRFNYQYEKTSGPSDY